MEAVWTGTATEEQILCMARHHLLHRLPMVRPATTNKLASITITSHHPESNHSRVTTADALILPNIVTAVRLLNCIRNLLILDLLAVTATNSSTWSTTPGKALKQ